MLLTAVAFSSGGRVAIYVVVAMVMAVVIGMVCSDENCNSLIL